MTGITPFTLRGRNPDVLTCIANLFAPTRHPGLDPGSSFFFGEGTR